MDECPSGLRSTPRKRVRVTPSASSNLASSASRVSSKSLETLFCSRLCIFARVCSYISQKGNKCGRRDCRVKSGGVKSWARSGVIVLLCGVLCWCDVGVGVGVLRVLCVWNVDFSMVL